jgi:trans-2,3-dihydro-3-hydroxyanthranilate isomerase
MGYQLDIVDVFATSKYTGNQLAVLSECSDLTTDEMRRIAAEMNYSETTFVESSNTTPDGFPVRIFTPKMELPFAGHPTLGTAHVIRERFLDHDSTEITLDLTNGPTPVTVENNGSGTRYWMRQQPPEFTTEVDHQTMATVLGLDSDDLNATHPVREVSTGLPVLITPLTSLDAVRRASPDWEVYEDLLGGLESESLLVFAPETYHEENDLNVRVFSRRIAQDEDAANGSGNGCLAGYLAETRYFDSPTISARIEQGYEIDRPSLLHVEASQSDETEVSVGGEVSAVARGELL